MLDFIRALINLYIKRYESRIFFVVEQAKNVYPIKNPEHFEHECVINNSLSQEDYNLLLEFENGYFFDPAFQIEKNCKEMHLELIKYYVLNMFNNKNENEFAKKESWMFIPSITEKYITRIIDVVEKDSVIFEKDFSDIKDYIFC